MNFEKENEYLYIAVILVVSTGFGDDQFYGKGVIVVASMYPVSRIVAKPINCKYTSFFDNMLLFRTLRYAFCKYKLLLEHRYMYSKRILNSTIISNVEVCFIQMQCVIEALICIFKTF